MPNQPPTSLCTDRHVLNPPRVEGCPVGWVRRDELQPGMTVRNPRGRRVLLDRVNDGDYTGTDEFGERYDSPGPPRGYVVVIG